MTFAHHRNAATNLLSELGIAAVVTNNPDRRLKLAELHIELAKAEAFHEVATSLTNVAGALGSN